MKVITWNVNGLRSVLGKKKDGSKFTDNSKNVLESLVEEYDPDILCLQETKCPENLKVSLPFEYSHILSSKTKKGYSGVAIFSKIKPIKIHSDFQHNEEGRVLTMEFDTLYVVNVYVPNTKPDLSRLDYRINIWESNIRNYINKLLKKKDVIFCGDLNVAPNELDIHTVKGHENSHGFTIQERQAFVDLIKECKLIDTYRYIYPTEKKYTWFSNFAKSRERNKGWRIDHILVNKNLESNIVNVDILNNFYGSDHVPVFIELTN